MSENKENVVKKKRICCWCCCFSSGKTEDETVESESEQPENLEENSNEDHFVQSIQPLEVGSQITLKGKVQENCLRFIINLITSSGDIAFHFNPRLDRRFVVRNCKLEKSWGLEEVTSISKFDFAPNAPFTVNFLCCVDEYMVSINGKHFCAFSHRLQMSSVSLIEVQGLVVINNFDIHTVSKYPDNMGEEYYKVPMDKEVDVSDGAFQQNLEVPFTGSLPSGFEVGWQLEIYGRIKLLPQSFYVNLQDSTNIWPHPKIPLHLNPRFATATGANTFVRNTWQRGVWQKEERAPSFPFLPGNSFSMVVRKEREGFSVWVDGKLAGEFMSNHSGFSVRAVYIQGDIVLHHVSMRTKISDTYFQFRNVKCLEL